MTEATTQSSGFDLSDSLTFDELEAQLQQGIFEPIPPAAALQHLSALTLPAAVAQKWCQGQRIPWNDTLVSTNSPLRIYNEGMANFLGIGYLINSDPEQLLVPQMVLDTNWADRSRNLLELDSTVWVQVIVLGYQEP